MDKIAAINHPVTIQSMASDRVFKACLAKCAKQDLINLAGESIHHTVYQCM